MSATKRTLSGVAALLVATSALAAQGGSRVDGSRAVQLSETTTLLGTSVPRGTYTLRWTREPKSESVKLELAKGKNVVATGKGRWVETDYTSPYEALVYKTGKGTSELSEIQFRKSMDAIRVDLGSTQADASKPQGSDTN